MSKDQVALRVQDIIAGVDGVAGLYPARSAVLAGLARTSGASETLVAVDDAGSRVNIRVRIAALTESSAPRLVRDVAAAVRAGLADETRVGSVDITVCGFTDTPFP